MKGLRQVRGGDVTMPVQSQASEVLKTREPGLLVERPRQQDAGVGPSAVVDPDLFLAALAARPVARGRHVVLDEMDDAAEHGHGGHQLGLGVQPEVAVVVVEAHAGGAAIRLHAHGEEEPRVEGAAHEEGARRRVHEEGSGLLPGETVVVPAGRPQRSHRRGQPLQVIAGRWEGPGARRRDHEGDRVRG